MQVCCLPDESKNYPPHSATWRDPVRRYGRPRALRAELQTASRDWPSQELALRQLCDLELLLNGGFSPLRGFMERADYESVCTSMCLANGSPWPIPDTLDVPGELARKPFPVALLALRDPEGVMLGAFRVEEVWRSRSGGSRLPNESHTTTGSQQRRILLIGARALSPLVR